MDSKEFPQYLNNLISGYQRAQVLIAALQAGVFELLEDPRDSEHVAQACGWDPRGARMLLDGLLALGLVEKTGTVYRNAPMASHCLVPGSPGDQTNILLHASHGWHTWARLGESLKTGTKVARDRKGRPPDELRAFICGMDDIARQSAQSILDAVDLSSYRRLLDLGTGPGTYSIAFLQAHDSMRATLCDVPEVIPIAKEQVAKANMGDRVDYVPGDFLEASLGSGYDLVLLSNIIHSYGPDTNAKLVARCYEALDSGGMLVIQDFLLDPGRSGPAFGLLFALHMFLHTDSGDTYTKEDVAQWTGNAGFLPGETVSIAPHVSLWLAKKP